MTSAPSNSGVKSLTSSSSNFSANPSHSASASPSFDSTARRSGPSSTATPTSPAPRKNQGARKQNRNRRRPFDRDIDEEEEEDAMAESQGTTAKASVRKGSNRKQQTSITHLLNLSTPPPAHHLGRSGRGYIRTTPSWAGSGHHAVDKSRFVNANYRFVVSPTGGKGSGLGHKATVPGAEGAGYVNTDSIPDTPGYLAHATNPDRHVDWVDVLQVIASAESQTQSCPICLSSPVAPRMARCGHIFCLPCLIRFAHSSNEEESTARKEARSKKCPICDEYFRIPDTRQVRFYHGMESPMPKPGDDVVLRLMQREPGLTLALPKEGGTDVANEGEDVPWHFAANVLDYARIMKGTDDYLLEQYDRELVDLQEQALADENMFGVEEVGFIKKAIRAVEAAKSGITEAPKRPITVAAPSKGKTHTASDPYYFYMTPPHLYLAPLDIRLLKSAFGNFFNFPSTLLPRVEHISTKTMDETLRKRAKYLSHVPLGCVVGFLECDWTDLVPEEVLSVYESDLGRRRKQHLDKAIQEERERLDAERLEASEMGARGVRRHLDASHGGVPVSLAIRDDDFVPLGPAGDSASRERAGFDQLADLSTSPSESRTVWGTRAVSGPDGSVVSHQPVNDGWLGLDELEDAHVAMQVEAMRLDEPSSSGGGGEGEGSGGGGRSKKKKKKQKITLMSTGGRRGW